MGGIKIIRKGLGPNRPNKSLIIPQLIVNNPQIPSLILRDFASSTNTTKSNTQGFL